MVRTRKLARARAVASLACGVVMCWAAVVTAHHPVQSGHPQLSANRTALGLSTVGTEVNYAGHHGFATTHTLWTDIAIGRWLSVEAQLPYARLSQDVGIKTRGLGDVEFGVQALVLKGQSERWDVGLGVAVELPTGRPEHGLGDVHVMMSPSVTARVLLASRWCLGLNVLGHFAVAGDEHDATPTGKSAAPLAQPMHGPGSSTSPPSSAQQASPLSRPSYQGSLLSPHHDYELRILAPLTYARGGLYGRLTPDAVLIFGEPSVFGPVSIEMTIGGLAAEHLLISAALMLPVAGEKRYDWRQSVMLGYQF